MMSQSILLINMMLIFQFAVSDSRWVKRNKNYDFWIHSNNIKVYASNRMLLNLNYTQQNSRPNKECFYFQKYLLSMLVYSQMEWFQFWIIDSKIVYLIQNDSNFEVDNQGLNWMLSN